MTIAKINRTIYVPSSEYHPINFDNFLMSGCTSSVHTDQ